MAGSLRSPVMPAVAVFGSSASQPGDGHWEEGVLCGRLLAEAGFTVVTGGYGGLMEAVSRGAADVGGHVIGVTVPVAFPGRPGANRFVTEELRAASLTERIHELTSVTDASIALHGSIGTLTELVVAWNLAYVDRFTKPPKPVIAVGPRWTSLVTDITQAVETDGTLVTCVDTVEQAVAEVKSRIPEG